MQGHITSPQYCVCRIKYQKIPNLCLQVGGVRGKFLIFWFSKKINGFINMISYEDLIPMTDVSGFCLKCKTYGPIKDGKLIKMSNGRTRCAGYCSQKDCTGKISKIVS
tara:strand:+ start:155 stop:478 length:324 start_codon:yes stop_codon:yes gene_type:complete